MFAQRPDEAVRNDVVGAEIAFREVEAGGKQGARIGIGPVIGGFHREDVGLVHRQAEPRHVLEEGLAAQAEVGRVDMGSDEADALETLHAEARQRLIDGVLVVHIDEIGVEHVVERIDEDGRQAEALDEADIGLRQLRAECDDAGYRCAGERFRHGTDRLALEAYHFQRVVAPRRLGRHAVDIVGDEDAVVAVDRVAMLGDLQEA
ncbi:hypothetical protein D9M70_468910 [compost metagenome]